MRKFFFVAIQLLLMHVFVSAQSNTQKINLAGEWGFQIDSLDKGIDEQWFNKKLGDRIKLPGSMTTNGKGNDVDVNTPWTGSIVDSGYFTKPEYAAYRKAGNIKVPFWLQPTKYYKGAAWYQRRFTVPASWKGKHVELFIERSHWETTVWVDGKETGMQNSLGSPNVFQLGDDLAAGEHTLSVRVDNRVKEINVGQNSHSISDHTQSNWNGMIGQLYLAAYRNAYLTNVALYPDIDNNLVKVKLAIKKTGDVKSVMVELNASGKNTRTGSLAPVKKEVQLDNDSVTVEMDYPMGDHPLLWDEFHPNVYNMQVALVSNGTRLQEKKLNFGMRKFASSGTQFTINNRLTFLRGTLECAIFPKTGYPPTDTAEWMRIFRVCRSYGLNHIRFHSWCPPEAAFDAADLSGFYLSIECDSWANQGAVIGDGTPLDNYIYEESNRINNTFGSHPSFCMMVYGNEPAGKNHQQYLTDFVRYWQQRDNRHLYTTGSGWPVIAESDYNSTPDPRIQGWGQGLNSIINGKAPSTDYDWRDIISKWQHPTVSHEIGQWCVYPDFKEIAQYTGVLKAKNFEIFQQTLADNGMKKLADSFLLASGKLQVLCYKADIEAALRTPGFGGFQLLDLHDFPGQGSALVGVLNPFWRDKGYVTGKEYSRFCNAVVPLARMKKLVYQNNETLAASIQIANFSSAELKENIRWNIKSADGKLLYSGTLPATSIPLGNQFMAGEISQSLSAIKEAGRFVLSVSIGRYENDWDFFVYPSAKTDDADDILVTQQLDADAVKKLADGGKVLLTIKKGSLKKEYGGDIAIGFSSIFWNTAWTNSQPPVTLGVLCNPAHPAFKDFPTQYYSNYQWQFAMSHSNALRLDKLAPGVQPVLRVIDDWVTARPLGLLFECKAGNGKLMVCGIDLLTDTQTRPEADQLLKSLRKYMAGSKFQPVYKGDVEIFKGMLQ